jgi:hypothetical protein
LNSEADPSAKRTNFCTMKWSHWTIQIRKHLRIRTLKIIFLSLGQNHIRRPRYEPFLCGADRDSWTLGTYNLEYFAIILIFYGF